MKLSRTILMVIVVLPFLQTQSSAGKFAEMMERLKKPISKVKFLPRFKLVTHKYEEFVPGQNNATDSVENTNASANYCDTAKGCTSTKGCDQSGCSKFTGSGACHKGCNYCDGSGCSICDIRVDGRLQKHRTITGDSYYPSRAPICESNFGFYQTCWRKFAPMQDRCRQKVEQLHETTAPKKVFYLPSEQFPSERSVGRPKRTDTIPVFDTERLKRETQTLEYYPPKTVSGVREK